MHQSLPRKVYPQTNTNRLLGNVFLTARCFRINSRHHVFGELKFNCQPRPSVFGPNNFFQKSPIHLYLFKRCPVGLNESVFSKSFKKVVKFCLAGQIKNVQRFVEEKKATSWLSRGKMYLDIHMLLHCRTVAVVACWNACSLV